MQDIFIFIFWQLRRLIRVGSDTYRPAAAGYLVAYPVRAADYLVAGKPVEIVARLGDELSICNGLAGRHNVGNCKRFTY